jgi:hypothetical protein
MPYITRKDWFNQHMLPIFKAKQPDMHITFDMFGNKSRDPKGFDHRTKSQALRDRAGKLHSAELAALSAYGTDDFQARNLDVYDRYMDFIGVEDAVSPHKTHWVRKYKKLDYEGIKKFIPDFTEIEFKSWSSRPDDDENADMLMLKFAFRKAYESLLRSGDPAKLVEWDSQQKAFYRTAA